MPFYYGITNAQTAQGLLRLRTALSEQIPERTQSKTLLLGTWNIREFDSPKYGDRSDESLYYIAEIISRFDLVAVQEVREDLRALRRLQAILGSAWSAILTDVTVGTQGNGERLVFLYDTAKVRFGGLAGEVMIPPISVREGRKVVRYEPSDQLARSPYTVGFHSGWFRFMICTTHILYGSDAADEPRRVREIDLLAGFLEKMAKDTYAWAKNLILLGDFNIYKPDDSTMGAIEGHGFVVPQAIKQLPSNVAQNRHYDQIAFIAPDVAGQLEACVAGTFNFYDVVYRDDDQELYAEAMGAGYAAKDTVAKRKRYYRDWRTYQMSDHLPMWVELQVDFGTEYLKRKAGEE